jgi:hypothetical protein
MEMKSSRKDLREGVIHRLRWHRKAAVSMGTIALVLMVVESMRVRESAMQVASQQKVMDQWAYANSKANTVFQYKVILDLFNSTSESNEKIRYDYTQQIKRYEMQMKEIEEKARQFEIESDLAEHHQRRLSVSEALLEIAIVLSLIGILTRRVPFWYFSLFAGFAGTIVALLAFP